MNAPRFKLKDNVFVKITVCDTTRLLPGIIYTVDPNGSGTTQDEPCYDVLITNDKENTDSYLLKHIRESALQSATENSC